MNLKSTSVFAGLIAGSALALSTLPAQAFTLNPNGSITFAAPETLEFTFLESRGFFRSSFGVYSAPNADARVTTLFTENAPGFDLGSSAANGDFLGTPGQTVNPFITSFTFAPGTYFFGLDSRPQGGTTFTTASGSFETGVPLSIPADKQGTPFTPPTTTGAPNQAFNSTADFYTRSTIGPGAGGPAGFTTINTSSFDFFTAINDTFTGDADVNDFIVGVRSTPPETVPEPATLAGLGLVAGAMTMLRRRKGSQVS